MKTIMALGVALIMSTGGLFAQNGLADGKTSFALDLYGEVADQPGNVAISPYSISLALAMTYAGAEGATAEEMARALHWPDDQARVHRSFAKLQTALRQAGKVDLNVANSIWIQQDYEVLASYLSTVTQQYGGHLDSANFNGDSRGAIAAINGWVDRETSGKIEQLFAPGSLSPLTRLVLVNAIYFKGEWATQFEAARTRSQPFQLNATQSVNVATMQLSSRLPYGSYDGVQVLSLPYDGNQLSMMVLLPKDLDSLKWKLTPDYLASLVKAQREQPVQVFLPRFKVSSDIDLQPPLSELGMANAFTTKANFAGINGNPNDLYLSKAVHQAVVEVNEQGTEAAAATGVVAVTRSRPQHAVFRADRPFVFLIRHEATGSILFMGRVSDPR